MLGGIRDWRAASATRDAARAARESEERIPPPNQRDQEID